MKRLMVGTGLAVLLLSTKCHAQSGAGIPPADAGRASQASCVILERMGRVARAESRLSSLGIIGKQFRYIEGKLPGGFSLHHKMTDHDVRNLQARGAQVLVLDSHYTADDLKGARAACHEEASKTSTQLEAKVPPIAESAPIADAPAPAQKPLTSNAATPKTDGSASSAGTTEPAGSSLAPSPMRPASKASAPKPNGSTSSRRGTDAALVDVSSTPDGADIYIDDRFFGQTPFTSIILMPGDHEIAIKKDGFVVWKKKLKLSSGPTNVDAQLHPKGK